MLRFSKGYASHCFLPVSKKLCGKYGNQGRIQAITFLGDLTKIKVYGTLNIVTQGHIWFGNFKTLLLQFSSNILVKRYDTDYHGLIHTLASLGNWASLKSNIALSNFIMEISGKIL